MNKEQMTPMMVAIVNGETVTIGTIAEIYRYSEGGIVARLISSGLTNPEFALRLTGLRLALAWINANR